MDISKRDDISYAYKGERGLDEAKIREISAMKNEPEWMDPELHHSVGSII